MPERTQTGVRALSRKRPITVDTDDVLEQAAQWRAEGRTVALATVVRTWGSSPLPAGSQLAVSDDGAFVGSVSGGCIEGAGICEGIGTMGDGAPRLVEFGVTSEMAWGVRVGCGG